MTSEIFKQRQPMAITPDAPLSFLFFYGGGFISMKRQFLAVIVVLTAAATMLSCSIHAAAPQENTQASTPAFKNLFDMIAATSDRLDELQHEATLSSGLMGEYRRLVNYRDTLLARVWNRVATDTNGQERAITFLEQRVRGLRANEGHSPSMSAGAAEPQMPPNVPLCTVMPPHGEQPVLPPVTATPVPEHQHQVEGSLQSTSQARKSTPVPATTSEVPQVQRQNTQARAAAAGSAANKDGKMTATVQRSSTATLQQPQPTNTRRSSWDSQRQPTPPRRYSIEPYEKEQPGTMGTAAPSDNLESYLLGAFPYDAYGGTQVHLIVCAKDSRVLPRTAPLRVPLRLFVVPALNQSHNGSEISNYCGYYALFNAQRILAELKKSGCTPDSIQQACYNRQAFGDFLRRAHAAVANQYGGQHADRSLELRDLTTIIGRLNLESKDDAIAVVCLQEILGADFSGRDPDLGAIMADNKRSLQHIHNFQSGRLNQLAIVLGTGYTASSNPSAHWLTVVVVRNGGGLDMYIVDSAADKRDLTSMAPCRILPLHFLLTNQTDAFDKDFVAQDGIMPGKALHALCGLRHSDDYNAAGVVPIFFDARGTPYCVLHRDDSTSAAGPADRAVPYGDFFLPKRRRLADNSIEVDNYKYETAAAAFFGHQNVASRSLQRLGVIIRTADVAHKRCFGSGSKHYVYFVNYGNHKNNADNPLRAVSEGAAQHNSAIVNMNDLYDAVFDHNGVCHGYIDSREPVDLVLSPDLREILFNNWNDLAERLGL